MAALPLYAIVLIIAFGGCFVLGCLPWIVAYFCFTGSLLDFGMELVNRINGLRSHYIELKCTIPVPAAAASDGEKGNSEDTARESKEDDDVVIEVKDTKGNSSSDGTTFRWHYLDSDPMSTLPVVILIHGFGAYAGSWAELGGKLRKSFRVISPDLTGHGQTLPQDSSMDYGIQHQTVRLKSLFDEILGADTKYHLVGTSMGGWISSNFATLFPENVLSMSLLCPAGVQPPLSDERKAEFEEARQHLVWNDVPGFRAMFPSVMVKKFRAPTRLCQCYVDEHEKFVPIGKKLLASLATEFSAEITKEKLEEFERRRLPVLLLWGDTDKIIPIEGMKLFQDNLTNVKSVVVPQCGHAVMLDKAAEACRAVFDFVSVVQADPLFFAEEKDGDERERSAGSRSGSRSARAAGKLEGGEKGGDLEVDTRDKTDRSRSPTAATEKSEMPLLGSENGDPGTPKIISASEV